MKMMPQDVIEKRLLMHETLSGARSLSPPFYCLPQQKHQQNPSSHQVEATKWKTNTSKIRLTLFYALKQLGEKRDQNSTQMKVKRSAQEPSNKKPDSQQPKKNQQEMAPAERSFRFRGNEYEMKRERERARKTLS